MVKIAIIGTGYVGLVSGACLAEAGHEVVCCDVDQEKIKKLRNIEIPIFEIGLESLVKKNYQSRRLSFSTDVAGAIRDSLVVFSCVGTPMGEDHKADLRYVEEVAEVFGKNLNSYKVFVNKSTVPVGTAEMVEKIVKKISSHQFDVVSNPEFLKEGAAVKDFFNPERIVIGTSSDKAREIMSEVYKPFARSQRPIIFTDVKSSELIKYASNSMLATRISFINEIANFCDKVGANVRDVSRAMGFDTRIGPKFLQAGIGYGGSCFPKDVVALIESGKEVGCDFEILRSVERVNQRQRTIIVDKLLDRFGDLRGKVFTIWGLSFKPRTDDVREAPALYIIDKLISLGAKVRGYDSVAKQNFKKFYPDFDIEFLDNKYDGIEESDALLVLTEWDEFRVLDFEKLVGNIKVVVDGRNIYESQKIINKGFDYIGIGSGNFQVQKIINNFS